MTGENVVGTSVEQSPIRSEGSPVSVDATNHFKESFVDFDHLLPL
jgi:hypothetical protein